LKAVIRHGYKITLIKGQPFTKDYIFNEYVNFFFKIKKLAKTSTIRFIAKMHLNQLYGYFGRSRELILTKTINNKDLKSFLVTHFVKTIIPITKKISIILMKANLNYDLIKKLKLDLDLLTLHNTKKDVKSNVAIAAAVTSYARIEMIRYKTDPNYNIFYSDTDSIFCNKPLPIHLIGDDLGLMKNELEKYGVQSFERAIFLGNKKYAFQFIDKDGKLITKTVFSGVKKKYLTWEHFEKMANGETITIEIPNIFTHNFKTLSISIDDRDINIKKSESKILLNNKYYPKHILKYNNVYHEESNNLVKLYKNLKNYIKTFINNYTPLTKKLYI
jgi:hypothetical protein